MYLCMHAIRDIKLHFPLSLGIISFLCINTQIYICDDIYSYTYTRSFFVFILYNLTVRSFI